MYVTSLQQLAQEIQKEFPQFTITYKVDPVRQSIADSLPQSIDDSEGKGLLSTLYHLLHRISSLLPLFLLFVCSASHRYSSLPLSIVLSSPKGLELEAPLRLGKDDEGDVRNPRRGGQLKQNN